MAGKEEQYKYESPFKPGMELGEWTLNKLQSSNKKEEIWLATHTETQKKASLTIPIAWFRERSENVFDNPEFTVKTQTGEALTKESKIDNWTLISKIATGSTGEVWQASHPQFKEPVALKIGLFDDKKSITDFATEINILNELRNDPGVIPILSYSNKIEPKPPESCSWLAMPLASDHKTYFKSHQQLIHILSMLLELVSTIERMMHRNIKYSDIKPENILYSNNRFVICDFSESEWLSDISLLDNQKYAAYISSEIGLVISDLWNLCDIKDYKKSDFKCDAENSVTQTITHYINKIISFIQKELPAEDCLHAARVCHRNHLMEHAINLYQHYLKAAPNDQEANFLLGLIYLNESNYKKAITQFISVTKIKEHPQASFALAQAYFRSLDFVKAEELVTKILEKKPSSNSAYNLLGEIQQQKHIMKINEQLNTKVKSTLNKENQNRLKDAFNIKTKLLSGQSDRMLFAGKADQLTHESYAIASWDQYFHDLSVGAYRDVCDGTHRVYRQRAWHYLFKNLNLINAIFSCENDEIRIADIGCSSAYLRRFLVGNYSKLDKQKLYYWGLDLRKDVLQQAVHASDYLESGAIDDELPSAFIQHDMQHGLPYKNEFFDYIVNFEVIKYLTLKNGRTLLTEMHRILKPNGKCYLSSSFGNFIPEHIEGLGLTSFANLLQQTGWEIKQSHGSQSKMEWLYNVMSPEHRKFADMLLSYHPKEIVAAMLAPFYPNVATQLSFVLEKIK